VYIGLVRVNDQYKQVSSALGSIDRFSHLVSWDRCYDHSVLRFLPFSATKLAFTLKTNVMTKSSKNAVFWTKVHTYYMPNFFGKNIFLIKASVPGNQVYKYYIYI
jgi:hypothetical protein